MLLLGICFIIALIKSKNIPGELAGVSEGAPTGIPATVKFSQKILIIIIIKVSMTNWSNLYVK